MKSLLYHGTPHGNVVIKSGVLLCNSYPEYDMDVPCKVLSLTRCKRFAEYCSRTARDDPVDPAIIVFDRDVLRTTHKLTPARSMIWDAESSTFERTECEEFVVKAIRLDHPALVEIIGRHV